MSTGTGCLPATSHYDLCHSHVLLPIPPSDWEPHCHASFSLDHTAVLCHPFSRAPWEVWVLGGNGEHGPTFGAGCQYPTENPPTPSSTQRRSQSTLEEVKSGEPVWGSHPSFSWMGFEDNKPVAPGRMETKCAVTEPGFMATNFTDLLHRNEDW